jgi:predicted enzyme related to lactoylglutathione lyase
MCLLRGKPVAALTPTEPSGSYWWNVYFAIDDCDRTARRITEAGGTLVLEPMDVMSQGRMAMAIDPVGAQFGLWQGGDHVGCAIVNEPNALIRNDLVTPDPAPARAFYAKVFDFTLDANRDLPDADFTFLRRPDGHEIGGIAGVTAAPRSRWTTMFEVEDADTTAKAALAAGGTAEDPQDNIYARMAKITDPFGTEFIVGSRPKG